MARRPSFLNFYKRHSHYISSPKAPILTQVNKDEHGRAATHNMGARLGGVGSPQQTLISRFSGMPDMDCHHLGGGGVPQQTQNSRFAIMPDTDDHLGGVEIPQQTLKSKFATMADMNDHLGGVGIQQKPLKLSFATMADMDDHLGGVRIQQKTLKSRFSRMVDMDDQLGEIRFSQQTIKSRFLRIPDMDDHLGGVGIQQQILKSGFSGTLDIDDHLGGVGIQQKTRISRFARMVDMDDHLGRGGIQHQTLKSGFEGMLDISDGSGEVGIPQQTLKFRFARMLEECGRAKSFSKAQQVHAHIIKSSLKNDRLLNNLLVSMYSKCGRVDEARAVFDSIPSPRLVSWNAMISAYARNRQPKLAMELFKQMQHTHIKPDKLTFISLLKTCSRREDLAAGRRIHSVICKVGFESDVAVGTALVKMYGKCGCPEFALKVFDQIPEKNTLSWSSMIEAYASNEMHWEALKLFKQMRSKGLSPDEVTFRIVLEVGGCLGALSEGKKIHAYIVDSGLEANAELLNALIRMYGRCGSLEHAVKVLRLKEMKGLKLEKINFVAVLKAICSPSSLTYGKQMHTQIINHGFELDVNVGSALVSMYGRCGDLEQAERTFAKLPTHDVVSWNAIIGAYLQNGHAVLAFEMFKQMRLQGFRPNRITCVYMLDACSKMARTADIEAVHAQIVESGYESDVVVGTALINLLGKQGNIAEASTVFHKMPNRNVFTWTAMISAFGHNGLAKEALACFQHMKSGGLEPNQVTFVTVLSAFSSFDVLAEGQTIHKEIIEKGVEDGVLVANALISMYDKCGSLKDAEKLFSEMPDRDVVSWNTLIGAYARHEQSIKAFHLFRQMQLERVNPDKITFLKMLDACNSVTFLEDGTMVHASIMENGQESDVVLQNSLIHMYSKCGNVEEARNVFNKMLERDLISWNTMIAEYADHGHGMEAIELFGQMHHEGFVSNRITLLNILAACSHAGLMMEAHHYFTSMQEDPDLEPTIEHFGCMMDLFARAGKLDEAEQIISDMPFKPDHLMWMALLRACKANVDVQ